MMTADFDESATSQVPDSGQSQVGADVPGWLKRTDRLFVLGLLIAGGGLLAVHLSHLAGWGNPTIEVERLEARKLDYRIDINTANWVEWIQLDGIGEARARDIVRDRDENGPFASIDDLTRVKGIGAKTLEKMRPWLEVRER